MAHLTIIESDEGLGTSWQRYLSKKADFFSVGLLSNSKDLFSNFLWQQNHVLVLNLDETHANFGFGIISTIKRISGDVNVLLVSSDLDYSIVVEYIKHGGCGHVTKPCSARKIYESIKTIQQGGTPLDPIVAKVIVKFYQENASLAVFDAEGKENSVLILLAQGRSYKEIASALSLSVDGVRYHIRNIYARFNASNKVEAIAKAKLESII